MNKNLTDITLVVDRSGSMEAIRADAEGGVNTFITEQAKLPGDALLTLVQFDTRYEFVHKGVPVKDVPRYQLVPAGATALLDAVGRAINETGHRLSKMPENDRPGLVVLVVVTDGHENSSKEFTKAQVRAMIEEQQTKYSWQFTFLGADQDAFDDATQIGIQASSAAVYAKAKAGVAWVATSSKVARMRAQASAGLQVQNLYTEEERMSMSD